MSTASSERRRAPAPGAALSPRRVAVLMPCFNEGRRLSATLADLAGEAGDLGGVTVYLVDDGSAPRLDLRGLPPARPAFGVVVARHAVNLGQGAALETARRLALASPAHEAFLTMDADGQHGAGDAAALAREVFAGADVVFGDRFRGASNTPPLRRALLQAARLFEQVLTGLELSDAHNGLRAFSRRALERVPIRQNRMAHATEIKQRVARARPLVIRELPVSVRYTEATLAKGQSARGAFAILHDLVHRYLFAEHE